MVFNPKLFLQRLSHCAQLLPTFGQRGEDSRRFRPRGQPVRPEVGLQRPAAAKEFASGEGEPIFDPADAEY